MTGHVRSLGPAGQTPDRLVSRLGLTQTAGRRITLADVAACDWDAATPAGADAVWLMGVWERSPPGLAVAAGNAELQASFRDALPACALRT
jgi:hypothetical protein